MIAAVLLLVITAAGAGVAAGFLVGRRRRDDDADAAVGSRRPADDPIADVLREAVNHLEIGLVVADRDGSIIFRNDAATAAGETHAGVLIAGHLDDAIAEAAAGKPARQSVDLHGPPRMSLAIAAEPIPSGGVVATIHDLSERVRVDAMRTDFVANISHELRTPVGAIAVLADALVGEEDPEIVARVAQRLFDESNRAVRTIDDLLELSRIEASRAPSGVVDLGEVINAAVVRGQLVRGEQDVERNVVVSNCAASASVRLRGDARQLTSAIGNLVENAVKYSHDSAPVQIRTRIDDQAIEVIVADRGVGIPRADLDRVFERFYRVDKARGRDTGGTGLGLSIVRHVAHNHGGQVLVSSEEGEGSTFVLRLPATLVITESVSADPPDPDDPAAGAHGGHPSGSEDGGRRRE